MKLLAILEGKAFNKALAGESITDSMKQQYDADAEVFNGITHQQLYEYAKIIAMKTLHNIENGHKA